MNTCTKLVHLGGGVKMLEMTAGVEDRDHLYSYVFILPQFYMQIFKM